MQHCKNFTELVHTPECLQIFPRWLGLSGLLSFISSMELIVSPESVPAIQTPQKGFPIHSMTSCIDIFPCSLYYNQRDSISHEFNNAQKKDKHFLRAFSLFIPTPNKNTCTECYRLDYNTCRCFLYTECTF